MNAPTTKSPSWLDLESAIPLRSKRRRNAEEITGLSAESLKRHYAKYVNKVGERRETMKLKHALAIAGGELG